MTPFLSEHTHCSRDLDELDIEVEIACFRISVRIPYSDE